MSGAPSLGRSIIMTAGKPKGTLGCFEGGSSMRA